MLVPQPVEPWPGNQALPNGSWRQKRKIARAQARTATGPARIGAIHGEIHLPWVWLQNERTRRDAAHAPRHLVEKSDGMFDFRLDRFSIAVMSRCAPHSLAGSVPSPAGSFRK